jgi:hypothetical protein
VISTRFGVPACAASLTASFAICENCGIGWRNSSFVAPTFEAELDEEDEVLIWFRDEDELLDGVFVLLDGGIGPLSTRTWDDLNSE